MSIMPKKWFARFSRIIAMIVLENSDKMVTFFDLLVCKRIPIGF